MERGGEKKQTGGGQNSDKGWVPLLFARGRRYTKKTDTLTNRDWIPPPSLPFRLSLWVVGRQGVGEGERAKRGTLG